VGCREKETGEISSEDLGVKPVEIAVTAETEGLVYETATISEETEKYHLDVNYPVFNGGDQEVLEVINRNILGTVRENIAQFDIDYEETDHEYDPGPWFLGYDFKVTRNDKYFVSVVLEGSIYQGGAHPNQIYETFVFNLEEGGVPMQLQDVFNTMALVEDDDSGAKIGWLDYLVNRAQLKLLEREYADADWIKSGAGPDEGNFQMFYITDKDFVIIFPPYQVASYAEGPQEVAISFEDLAGYLKAYAF
jgi:hypothetical protein